MSNVTKLKIDNAILILCMFLLLFSPSIAFSLIVIVIPFVSFRKFLIRFLDFKINNRNSIYLIVLLILKPCLIIILALLNKLSANIPVLPMSIIALLTCVEGILIMRFSYLLKYMANDLFGRLRSLRYVIFTFGVLRMLTGFFQKPPMILEKDFAMFLFSIFNVLAHFALLVFMIILVLIYTKFIKSEKPATE